MESCLSTWHTPTTSKKKAMETFRPAIAKAVLGEKTGPNPKREQGKLLHLLFIKPHVSERGAA